MTAIATEPNLFLVGEELILKDEGGEFWRLPLSALRVIGEYTNEDGPFAEDWFAVFITSDREWFLAELTPSNTEVIRVDLAGRLGTQIEFGLFSSATFASRIILPIEYARRPLFSITYASGPTLAGRFWGLFGIKDVHLDLTEEAKSAVAVGLS